MGVASRQRNSGRPPRLAPINTKTWTYSTPGTNQAGPNHLYAVDSNKLAAGHGIIGKVWGASGASSWAGGSVSGDGAAIHLTFKSGIGITVAVGASGLYSSWSNAVGDGQGGKGQLCGGGGASSIRKNNTIVAIAAGGGGVGGSISPDYPGCGGSAIVAANSDLSGQGGKGRYSIEYAGNGTSSGGGVGGTGAGGGGGGGYGGGGGGAGSDGSGGGGGGGDIGWGQGVITPGSGGTLGGNGTNCPTYNSSGTGSGTGGQGGFGKNDSTYPGMGGGGDGGGGGGGYAGGGGGGYAFGGGGAGSSYIISNAASVSYMSASADLDTDRGTAGQGTSNTSNGNNGKVVLYY